MCIFQLEYERCFGYLEWIGDSDFSKFANECTLIKSTGYGLKLLIGFMMTDRFNVARILRQQKRERVQFIEFGPQTLHEEDRNCLICRQKMGLEPLEGRGEACIEMVICCGQYIGAACLKKWLHMDNFATKRCPHCRQNLSRPFLVKLFGNESSHEHDFDDNDPANLIADEFQQPLSRSGLVNEATIAEEESLDDFQMEG